MFLHTLSDDSWFSPTHTSQGKDQQFQLDQGFYTWYANTSVKLSVHNQLCPSVLRFLLGWSQQNNCLLQLFSDTDISLKRCFGNCILHYSRFSLDQVTHFYLLSNQLFIAIKKSNNQSSLWSSQLLCLLTHSPWSGSIQPSSSQSFYICQMALMIFTCVCMSGIPAWHSRAWRCLLIILAGKMGIDAVSTSQE